MDYRIDRHRTLLSLGAGAVILALTITTSWATASQKGKASQELTKVTMATVPIASVAPIKLGKLRGFFRDEGIDLQVTTKIPNSQQISSLLSNNIQFTTSSWGVLISVRANNVPIKALANLADAGAGKKPTDDDFQIVTTASSSFTSLKQMAGKTYALPTLGGLSETVMRNLAAKNGVKPSDLKLIGLNFADMPAALRAGRIDAAFMGEPFITQLRSQTNVRTLSAGHASLVKSAPVVTLLAADSYAQKNPKIVAAVRRATERSVKYARTHPVKVRKVLPSILNQPGSITRKLVKPVFNEKIERKRIQRLADLMFKFGQTRSRVNISESISD